MVEKAETTDDVDLTTGLSHDEVAQRKAFLQVLASGSCIDRELPNIQDYLLGLSWRCFRDCGKHLCSPLKEHAFVATVESVLRELVFRTHACNTEATLIRDGLHLLLGSEEHTCCGFRSSTVFAIVHHLVLLRWSLR